MIIPIHYGQMELKLNLTQPGAEGRRPDPARLRLTWVRTRSWRKRGSWLGKSRPSMRKKKRSTRAPR
jgi:hypothetical protein